MATDERCLPNAEGLLSCKPAAGTMANLGDGRFLHLNALEGTENVELSIVAEFSEVSGNDQSRVLTLDANDRPSWVKPSPVGAGVNPDGNDSTTLASGLPLIPDGALDTADNTAKNDGALFCADVTFLADGRVMAVGGTDYYSEPGIDGLPVGVAELVGLKNSRILDPDANTWTQSGDMNFGHWYPTLVTLADGDVFVASGVTKLLKPSIRKIRSTPVVMWLRPRPTIWTTVPGPKTAARPSARCPCFRVCICCPTARSITTRAARRSTF